ncbi:hypothetical protein SEA_KLEVEY_73 [Arthrobacter phage Klevey]|uniref:Uncharacterized protein n=1 Tax=Arthrobacter phage Klevey TaxID=2867481 RepID=A0AAE8XKE4_9CAUD|nr:hypothetical protein SEA_KLEVEY_73 [Arthrobacter phage Klevey]
MIACRIDETEDPYAEPSREDRYEAAVRAVLDLCDSKDVLDPDDGRTVAWGQIDSREIRRAIAGQLAPETPAPVRRERIEFIPGVGIRIEEGE